MSETGDLITRIYSNFRGVDFRGEEINLVRSPDSLNVWKDYKNTESIRTRPGLRKIFEPRSIEMPQTIYGVFFFRNEVIVHANTWLYKFDSPEDVNYLDGSATVLYKAMAKNYSNGFVYGDNLYIQDGEDFLMYDGTIVKGLRWQQGGTDRYGGWGYIPTTSIGRKPAGGGTIHEDVNMITPWRINTFLADGESKEFHLDAQNCYNLPQYKPLVKVNDVETDKFSWNPSGGIITFNEAPPAPATDGRDNVWVQFAAIEQRAKVARCTVLQVFDNRVFISGNPLYPNTVWHCSLDDPSYWSDLDYYREGVDNAMVNGLVAGNNALWAFREASDANTTVFYHVPTIDNDYGKIYPSQHSSVTTGCIGKAINFNDDIVFFSERGMEGISGDITTEQAVAHRSSLVDSKMLSEAQYKNMSLIEWEGYLMVFIGNKVYLADSRTSVTVEGHREYEWFYWELEKEIKIARVHDGVLYLASDTGFFALDDFTSDVESYWVTPKDKFKSPHKLKTTNKRGCVVEATGDISVYAKLEDTDFELIGTYENVTDYFVSRIKRKKFKDIQLKFYSKTRFSLETATLECFIGGYIKR